MSKYQVTGKMVIHISFDSIVEADDPVEAEQKAVALQRIAIEDMYNVTTNERPIDVTTKWLGD